MPLRQAGAAAPTEAVLGHFAAVPRTPHLQRLPPPGGPRKAAGEHLPYALDRLRPLILEALAHDACTYCRAPLTTANFSLDHFRPVSRGGRWNTGNLVVCCRRCDETRGALTSHEFRTLLTLAASWHEPQAARDLLPAPRRRENPPCINAPWRRPSRGRTAPLTRAGGPGFCGPAAWSASGLQATSGSRRRLGVRLVVAAASRPVGSDGRQLGGDPPSITAAERLAAWMLCANPRAFNS